MSTQKNPYRAPVTAGWVDQAAQVSARRRRRR
jgi:hypothetical protein